MTARPGRCHHDRDVASVHPKSSPLVSEVYRELQRKLHENPGYGVASVHYAPLVADIIKAVGATEMLDYGAGKGVSA